MQENPVEVHNLFKELLIGVTRFRDPQSWEYLSRRCCSRWARRTRAARRCAWVPGCSTGEEAFSSRSPSAEQVLAGVVACRLADLRDRPRSRRDRSRPQGHTYPASVAADLSSERLARFFVADGESYRVRKEIRDMVIFAQ
ncbi:MAG: hypothetical protein IPK80_27335 [Nannocystis sp.]|nr:hypothetical protein [Nannocystis sp.]